MQNNPLDTERFWSVASEGGVLGSMIFDDKCVSQVLLFLPDTEMFYREENRIIYDALLALYMNKISIDSVTLREELTKRNQLEKIGGVEYLQRIIDTTPSAANVVFYAKVVREKYRYRGMVQAIEEIKTVPDQPIEINEQIEQIQNIALTLQTETPRPDFVDFGIAPDVVEGLKKHTELIPTGFSNIDHIIQGIALGEFIILAGRPSMGKSALMLDIALNIAKPDVGVLIFTLEMPERALVARAVCGLASMSLAKIKGGFFPNHNFEKLMREAERIKGLPIVLSSVGETAEQQIALIRRLKKTHKIDCVFVDYLQLMHTTKKTESRQQDISEITRKLRRAAIKEQVSIVALSQLNRAPEIRAGHRPIMSDLRESGSIEQDADVVMLLYREDYYRRSIDPQA